MLSVEAVLNLPNVTRWHSRAVSRRQTLAEHCGMVALLALAMCPPDWGLAEREQLLRLSLVHDMHETVYGDIPFPAKQAMVDAGFDVDQHCQEQFWGQDIFLGVPARVVGLLRVADVAEAAQFAQRHGDAGLASAVYAQAWAAFEAEFPATGPCPSDRAHIGRRLREVLP